MSVKVVDNLPQFKKSAERVLNDALREGSTEILEISRNKAPFKDGGLRRESDKRERSHLNWRISYWVEYARYQEFGGDGKRVVRKYTTPGTGAHYLENAGDKIKAKMDLKFIKHGRRAGGGLV